MRVALLGSLLASLSGAACGNTEIHEFRDEGSLCLQTEPEGALLVTVEFPTCLSSSCDELLESTCSIERSGTTLTVRAYAKVETSTGDCTADCGSVTPRCSHPNLPPGSYTLRYGGDQTEISAPADPQYHFGSGAPPACALNLP